MDTQGLYIVTFVIGALAVGTVTGLVLEYTQWRAGRRIYPLRHWLLRLLGGLLLLIILGMIFMGVVIMDFQNPFHFSLYWSVCLLLVFSLLVLGLVDLRQIAWYQLQKERELTEEINRTWSSPRASSREEGPDGPHRGNGDQCE